MIIRKAHRTQCFAGPLERRNRSVGFKRLIAFVLASCAACGDGSRDDAVLRASPPGSRKLAHTSWDTVFEVRSLESDTLLLRPRTMAAGGRAVYVFDYGDRSVKAFDSRGRMLWRFGRKGAGPGEFGNVFDMETDVTGALWLSDVSLGRVTVLSQDGVGYRQFVANDKVLGHIVPIAGALVSTQMRTERSFVLLDSSGRAERTFDVPVPEARFAAPVMRQMLTSHAGDGRTWAVIFPFGSPILVFDGTRPRCIGDLVEGGPFQDPRAALRPQVWAASVAVSDSTVYVLPRGVTANALKMIDEYSATTCAYRRSHPLPRKAISLAVRHGTLYIGYEDPVPGILALRRR